MRRLLMSVLLLAALLPGGPAGAQATADQLNKLSLEALTTPAPGGNPGPRYGYSPRRYSAPRGGGHRYGYAPRRYGRRPVASARRSYRAPQRRRYAAPAYQRRNHYVPNFYRPRR